MRYFFLIAFAFSLAACQPAYLNGMPNENSPFFNIPVDSKLVLRSRLSVQAGDDGVYFQDGKAMRWSDVNIYRAYCALRIENKQTPQTVTPDTFIVAKTYNERFFKQVRGVEPVQVAATGRIWLGGVDLNDRGDGGYDVMAMVMELRSARQPQVSRLICAEWRVPQGSTYITVAKTRQVLGDYFSLELAAPGAR